MSYKSSKIKNLDTLEKEIYRLRLEAKNTEEKLEDKFEYLQHHYASMTMHTLFSHSSPKEDGKERIKQKLFNSIWENERIHEGLNKIISYLADKASEGIENLVDKIFHKKD